MLYLISILLLLFSDVKKIKYISISRYEDILMCMTLKCVSLEFELDRNNSKLVESKTTLIVVCLCFEHL